MGRLINGTALLRDQAGELRPVRGITLREYRERLERMGGLVNYFH